jgi:hypothetical protein
MRKGPVVGKPPLMAYVSGPYLNAMRNTYRCLPATAWLVSAAVRATVTDVAAAAAAASRPATSI